MQQAAWVPGALTGGRQAGTHTYMRTRMRLRWLQVHGQTLRHSCMYTYQEAAHPRWLIAHEARLLTAHAGCVCSHCLAHAPLLPGGPSRTCSACKTAVAHL